MKAFRISAVRRCTWSYVCALLLLSGCGSGDRTLRIAVDEMPEQIDPVLSGDLVGRRIGAHLYESLFRQNEEGEILPHLADDYIYDTSYTCLTIHLREDVLFHDGDRLTAYDVVYSLQRILDFEEEGLLWVGTSSDQLGHPITIRALDDLTLEIVIPVPHYSLLRTLTTPFLAPIIKKELGEGPGHTPPIGTGPYRVKQFSPGRGTVLLERNNRYWGARAIPDRIGFTRYFDDDEKLDAIDEGKADIAENIGVSSDGRFNLTDRMVLKVVTRRGWLVLGINNQQPPFSDVNMRRALAMALDTREIVKERWGRAGEVMWFFVGEGLEPDLRGPLAPTINPDRAADLFSQEITREIGQLKYLRSLATDPEETELLSHILRERLIGYGLDIKQEFIESFSTYNELLRQGEWNLNLDGYATDNGDLYSFLYEIYGRSNPDGSNGLFRMDGDKFVELLERANTSVDDDERREYFRLAVEWIADQVPCIPLADLKSFLILSSEVIEESLDPGPFADWTYSSVSKEGWQ